MADILLVEDDPNVGEAICFVLKRDKHTVTRKPDKASAEAALLEQQFDLIITDIWLGEDDGLSLLKNIKAENSETPVIVISGGGPGRSLENVTARADAYGAIGILYKPFSNAELLKLVNQALGL